MLYHGASLGVTTALMRAERDPYLFATANFVSRKALLQPPFYISTESADSAPASWGGDGVSVAVYTSTFPPSTATATAIATADNAGPSTGEDVMVGIEAGAVLTNVSVNAEARTAAGGGGDVGGASEGADDAGGVEGRQVAKVRYCLNKFVDGESTFCGRKSKVDGFLWSCYHSLLIKPNTELYPQI